MSDSRLIRLFIDTATKTFALGARVDDKEKTIDLGNPKKVLELTHVGIQKLGEERNFTRPEIKEYYCLLGPGSNTGIRLGLTIPRTVYVMDPTIKIYGIETRKLLSAEADSAVLSDRNGNLFYFDKDRKESHIRIRKEDIASYPFKGTIAVEDSDSVSKEALKGKNIVSVNVLSLRRKHKDLFIDFSDKEEEYLPEYARKI